MEKVCWNCESSEDGLPKGETLEFLKEEVEVKEIHECSVCTRELATE